MIKQSKKELEHLEGKVTNEPQSSYIMTNETRENSGFIDNCWSQGGVGSLAAGTVYFLWLYLNIFNLSKSLIFCKEATNGLANTFHSHLATTNKAELVNINESLSSGNPPFHLLKLINCPLHSSGAVCTHYT